MFRNRSRRIARVNMQRVEKRHRISTDVLIYEVREPAYVMFHTLFGPDENLVQTFQHGRGAQSAEAA